MVPVILNNRPEKVADRFFIAHNQDGILRAFPHHPSLRPLPNFGFVSQFSPAPDLPPHLPRLPASAAPLSELESPIFKRFFDPLIQIVCGNFLGLRKLFFPTCLQ
jgi:hypothetical protein